MAKEIQDKIDSLIKTATFMSKVFSLMDEPAEVPAEEPAKIILKKSGRPAGAKNKSLHKVNASDANIAGMRQELIWAKSAGRLSENQVAALDAMHMVRINKLTPEQKAQIVSIYEDLKS